MGAQLGRNPMLFWLIAYLFCVAATALIEGVAWALPVAIVGGVMLVASSRKRSRSNA